jgi:hypothetical protein
MRKFFLGCLLAVVASLGFVLAEEVEAGHSAYALHDGQPLLADKSPDARPVGKLKAHHEYTVSEISGKWAKIKIDPAEGWVYLGNLSRDEPPDVNTSAFHTEASGTSLTAAARGLDDDAKQYASRKDEAESARQIVWMEQQNDAISKSDVKNYLKEHHLGEYGGGQ